jgi:hypothetical protein
MAAQSWEPTNFSNLGDAIDRSGDPDAPTVIDLSGPAPRLYSYREIDGLADVAARGLRECRCRPARGPAVVIPASARADANRPCRRGEQRHP